MKSLHNEAHSGSLRDGGTFERLFEVAVLLADGMDRGLVEMGLTRPRAELLWLLRRQGSMTQRDISVALRCTPRNVTGLVDGLERARLVRRGKHRTDRRAIVVGLTPRGERVAAGMRADYERAAASVFMDLSATELASFSAALKKILRRLREPAESEARSSS